MRTSRFNSLLVRLIRGKSFQCQQHTGQDFPRGVPAPGIELPLFLVGAPDMANNGAAGRLHLAIFNISSGKICRRNSVLALAVQITLYQIAVWLILGLLAGSLTGLIVKGEKRGFGLQTNLVLGLSGAIVGGLIFNLFGLLPNLDKIAISLRDVVAALGGSFLILAAFWLWRRRKPQR